MRKKAKKRKTECSKRKSFQYGEKEREGEGKDTNIGRKWLKQKRITVGEKESKQREERKTERSSRK